MPEPVLVLASSSPRRHSLLGGLGLSFEIASPDTDESVRVDEDPVDYVRRVAEEKSLAISSRLPVLAADTAVVVDGQILGKPGDAETALAMLTLLSDREHLVFSGVAIAHHGVVLESLVVETHVDMADIGEAEARWYVGSGEPLDKAGAYAIQGLGGVFVTAIRGSVSNVTGLPLAETAALLRRAGVEAFRRQT